VHRVVINGRFLSQAITGVQRFAREVVRALDDLIERDEIDRRNYQFSLAVPPGFEPDLLPRHIPIHVVGTRRGQFWEQASLAAHEPAALLLSMGNLGPLVRSHQVVVIHDASVFAVPAAYSIAFRTWYRINIRRLGRCAERVITPSRFSADELAHHAGIARGRFTVVHLGADHLDAVVPDQTVFARHGIGERPYLLAVSSDAPHKNLIALARALPLLRKAVPDLDVVSVGGSFPAIFAGQEDLSDRITRVGYARDAELKALYQRAQCFVYPSWYEGFGLPPLEAMRVGCPVVVSQAASLPEICADGALYFDPKDPATLAEAVGRLMGEAGLRDSMRAAGQRRAAQFTWGNTARGVFAVLQGVLR
jgi:glycosyltransferase involved in cell wall biosynthesis